MAIHRDNDEERMTRIEHILARLADGRANTLRIQAEARRVLSEIRHATVRPAGLLESVRSALQFRGARKSPRAKRR